MSIERIDYEKCTGCGQCVKNCNMDVIRMDKKTGKPIIKYVDECIVCMYCEEDCPVQAIFVSPEKKVYPFLSWG